MSLTGIMELEMELLNRIAEICDYPEPLPDDISVDDPLTGTESPLALDSLDAVEIVVMIQKEYGVRIKGQESGRIILSTLESLANFIRENGNSK